MGARALSGLFPELDGAAAPTPPSDGNRPAPARAPTATAPVPPPAPHALPTEQTNNCKAVGVETGPSLRRGRGRVDAGLRTMPSARPGHCGGRLSRRVGPRVPGGTPRSRSSAAACRARPSRSRHLSWASASHAALRPRLPRSRRKRARRRAAQPPRHVYQPLKLPRGSRAAPGDAVLAGQNGSAGSNGGSGDVAHDGTPPTRRARGAGLRKQRGLVQLLRRQGAAVAHNVSGSIVSDWPRGPRAP